jgi:hypothetical protein
LGDNIIKNMTLINVNQPERPCFFYQIYARGHKHRLRSIGMLIHVNVSMKFGVYYMILIDNCMLYDVLDMVYIDPGKFSQSLRLFVI